MIRISVNQSAKSRNGKEKLQGEKKIAAMAITREEENKTRWNELIAVIRRPWQIPFSTRDNN